MINRTPATEPDPADTPPPAVVTPFTPEELNGFRQRLLDLRDRLIGEISFQAGENLHRSANEQSGELSRYTFHLADHGTDNFATDTALGLVSSEQDLVYEINEALQRIEEGTYGICEQSGDPIPRERLEVLPYARFTVQAQNELERIRRPRR
jgi:RNA polymerase-binding transcription factor DksA